MYLTIEHIRRINAQYLVLVNGGIGQVSKDLEMLQPNLSSRAGKMPNKPVSNSLARKLEATYKKANGWMDHAHKEVEEVLKKLKEEKSFLDRDNLLIHYKGLMSTSLIPIIEWDEITEWVSNDYFREGIFTKDGIQVKATISDVSNKTYALKVNNDLMTSDGSLSYPVNSVLIVDPEIKPNNTDRVILATSHIGTPIFRQFFSDGDKIYCTILQKKEQERVFLQEDYVYYGKVVEAILN